MVQCSNSSCNKEIYGNGKFCRCKKYMFCDNTCYRTRQFREEHKQICEDRYQMELKRKNEEKLIKNKTVKQRRVAQQPRTEKGRFDNIHLEENDDMDEEQAKKEEERKAKQKLHSVTFDRKENIIKACKGLQEVRPNWRIKTTIIRTDKFSKADPVIYETPHADAPGTSSPAIREGPVHEHEGGEEVFDMEEQELRLDEMEDPSDEKREQIKPFCYICGRKIGTLVASFRCIGKLEDGAKCCEGACHGSCLNFQWADLDRDIMKRLKLVYLCPSHRKQREERDSGESDLEGGVEVRDKPLPKPKKVPAKVLYNTKTAIKDLMPEDKQNTPMTRNEIHKFINLYIKSRSLDAFRETNSTKINPFLKRTSPIPAQEVPAEPPVINPSANLDPVTEPRMSQHIAHCSRTLQSSSHQMRGNDADHGHMDDYILERLGDAGDAGDAEEDSPPYHFGDEFGAGRVIYPLMSRGSVSDESDDGNFIPLALETVVATDNPKLSRIEELRAAVPECSGSGQNTRVPKKYIEPGQTRKPFFNSPVRFPKLAKKSVAVTNSGESSSPAVGSSSVGSNISAERGKSDDQEQKICHQCGFFQYLNVLESSGCEYCNEV